MNRNEVDDVKLNLIKKSLEKESTEVYIPIERRKGNDFRLGFINLMSFIIWVVIVVILAIIEKVEKNMAYKRLENIENELWQVSSLKIALIVTICSIFICTICIFLNLTRCKRRSDKIKKSLIIAEFVCFIIGFFLIKRSFGI